MSKPDVLGSALQIVATGLRPFVEIHMRRIHGDHWERVARAVLQSHQATAPFDVSALTAILIGCWSTVFRTALSPVDRAYISEIRDVRNRWAHQEPLDSADTERALDTARRLLRAISAESQLRELDELTGVVRPGVVRKPATPTGVMGHAQSLANRRRAPSNTDWTSPAEDLISAFVAEFGSSHQRFGSRSLGYVGVCDGVPGVQWSVAMDLQSGHAHMSVNLEGMQYDGWPIARFIERELNDPTLLAVVSRVRDPSAIVVIMWRDAWQAASRVRIVERTIADTPVSLNALTDRRWRAVLTEAYQCLAPERSHRGRHRTEVTLARSGERVVRDISPHLNFQCDIIRKSGWISVLRHTREHLEPLHEFTARRAAN